MQQDVVEAGSVDKLSEAFEHSITWEDDIWRADPVDVPAVHAKARRKFSDLLSEITTGRLGAAGQSRILLFHGQSGAGKTHLGFAVCAHFLSRGRGVVYRSYQQLMNEMKSALNTEGYEELLRDYGRADVLYIDDFMKYPPSAADIRHSFELINRRVMTDGVTVITSEQPLDTVIGYDEALGGRIRQQCGEFAFYVAPGPGRNWRLK